MIYDRFLVLIWSVMLSLLFVMWVGTTNILSQTFSVSDIKKAADILFFVSVIVFAAFLWVLVPRPLSKTIKVTASLPPLLLLVFFLL